MPLAHRALMAAAGAGGALEWWDDGGGLCVGAWQAVGAVSLAASYTDLSGNGNNLTTGVAPSWNTTTGWAFTGSQYLYTGITPSSSTWSAIVRYSDATGQWPMGADGPTNTSGGQRWGILAYNVGIDTRFCNGGQKISLTRAETAGVLAFADRSYYKEGSLWGSDIPAGLVAAVQITIGGVNRSGGPVGLFTGKIQAVSIYNDALTGGQMASIYTAMAAL